MSLSYAQEKFSKAVYALAIGRGPIQSRLRDAWAYNIGNIMPERDLPTALQEEFNSMQQRMTSVSAIADEGSYTATTRQMSDDDAQEIVSWILETKYRLEDWED